MKLRSEAKKKRLAAALRENLRRRKSGTSGAFGKASAAAKQPRGEESGVASEPRLQGAKNRP